MNPGNQGQMGQPAPNGAQQGQARGPPMYRPEAIRQMNFLSDNDKARFEQIIRHCWQQLEANGPDAAEARRKIVEFSRAMVSKAQQARLMMQQKQALQQQQQNQTQQMQQQAAQVLVKQGQPQPNQNQPGVGAAQQQQPQGQGQGQSQGQPQPQGANAQAGQKTAAAPKTTTQNSPPATTTAAPASTSNIATAGQGNLNQLQGKVPEHIMQHVRQVPYHPPIDVVQRGPEAVKQWQQQYRQKYAMILVNMERIKSNIRQVENALRQTSPPLQPAAIKQLQDQREAHHKRHQDLGKWVENFRRNQQEAINQKNAANAVAGEVGGPGGGAVDHKPPQPGGGGATPTSAAQNSASLTQNMANSVFGAIEAAKNVQLPVSAIGRVPQKAATSQAGQSQTPTTTTAPIAPATGVSSPALTSAPMSTPTVSAAPSQPVIKTEPGTTQPMPPPLNTAIAANAATMSGTGTPTTGRAPQTPQSATAATPTNGVPRALHHNQAVNAANTANRAGQPGSAGASGQGSNGGTPSSAPGAGIGAAPGQGHPLGPNGPAVTSKFAISKQLPEKATAIPAPVTNPSMARPTMTQGSGTAGGVMAQPPVTRPPGFTFEGEAKHVLSKTKLDELCRQVCGGGPEGVDGNYLAADVEELVLNLADHFVDDVIRKACMVAKERGSKTLDIRDLQLILERGYNIRVPGYSSDELRTVRKILPTNAWITKMSAVQAAKVTARNGDL
ncbi:general RNA polymerase II transcription factor TAF12 [Zalerion maritima]|uniref:General RNA polymerase II transcription factor TAF12 n=1 Tax=Zalerion maritima TaxID=339359 RepID=A0AAD5RUL7_9PEZI|nr:general RNA polymerase II transcription factor TAF12 [Zalerion maritima]